MCELLCISSEEPARVDLSMEKLARRGTPESLNRDGWGIASYQKRDARLVKEVAPAGTSEIVRFIEEHDFWSTCVLYHLRHAITGELSYENTQPFAREMGGSKHVFCHNGDLTAGMSELTGGLGRCRPLGETDSELAFCALLARLEPLWLEGDDVPDLDARMRVVSEQAARLREMGTANFLYCDGDVVFVHAHWRPTEGEGSPPMPGLHLLEDDRVRQTSSVSVGRRGGRLLVAASVPLSDHRWRPMHEGELLAIRRGQLIASAAG